MRELAINEVNTVSGGSPEGIVAGAVLLGITGALIWGTSYSYPKTVYEMQQTPYTVTTPVYDAYGYYLGDQIDTYVREDLVAVTVY